MAPLPAPMNYCLKLLFLFLVIQSTLFFASLALPTCSGWHAGVSFLCEVVGIIGSMQWWERCNFHRVFVSVRSMSPCGRQCWCSHGACITEPGPNNSRVSEGTKYGLGRFEPKVIKALVAMSCRLPPRARLVRTPCRLSSWPRPLVDRTHSPEGSGKSFLPSVTMASAL